MFGGTFSRIGNVQPQTQRETNGSPIAPHAHACSFDVSGPALLFHHLLKVMVVFCPGPDGQVPKGPLSQLFEQLVFSA